MDLTSYLSVLRERWLPALIAALVVMGATVGITLLQTPQYQATNRLFVQTQSGSTAADLQQGATFAREQITTYADMARSPLVLGDVARRHPDLSTDDLAEMVSTTVPPDTLIIEITAQNPDPELAADIADETAASLSSTVASLQPSTSGEDAASGVSLTTIAPAVVPTSPSSPNLVRNALIGLVLALLAGFATAVIRDLMDNRVRRARDIEGDDARHVIGTIPASRDARHYPLISAQHPQSPQAEAFRDLRTNLQFVGLSGQSRIVQVTSSLPGEGKSSTSVNLANVLGQAGDRVLLIDADLRRPSLHEYIGAERGAGLTSVLIGDADLADVVQPTAQPGVELLASGPIPPNPSEMLGSAQMAALLNHASATYDYVVVDTPPLLAVTDAAVLSRLVGGTVVVAQAERVRQPQIQQALAKLDAVESKVLGVVLNRVRSGRHDYYSYNYQSEADAARPVDDPARAQPSADFDTAEGARRIDSAVVAESDRAANASRRADSGRGQRVRARNWAAERAEPRRWDLVSDAATPNDPPETSADDNRVQW